MTIRTAAMLTFLLTLAPSGARADSPPPWSSCTGLTPGDVCDLYPAGEGTCTIQADCTDPVETAENECLWCVGAHDDPSDGGSGCSTAGAAGGWALLAAAAVGWTRRRARPHGA